MRSVVRICGTLLASGLGASLAQDQPTASEGLESSAATLPPSPATAELQSDYETLQQAYQRTLYEVSLEPQKRYLDVLKDRHREAVSGKHANLAEAIQEEIDALEATLKEATDALAGPLKEVAPLPVEATVGATSGPLEVVADWAVANLKGGVVFNRQTGRLEGWQAGGSQALLGVSLKAEVTYSIVIEYASVEKGRLDVAVGDAEFRVALENTQSFQQTETVSVGPFRPKSDGSVKVTLSLPLHRTKAFLQLQRLSLIPLDAAGRS